MVNVHTGPDGSHRIGGASDYIQFGEAGQVGLVGAARVEQELAFSLDGIGRGSTAPTLTRLDNTVGYAFTIGDDGYMTLHIPLNWDDTASLEFALHVYIDEDYDITNGEVRFQGDWSAVPEDGTEAVDGATHTGTMDSGDIDIPSVVKAMFEIELGSIAAASLALHDTVFIKLSRVAVNDGTEATAEPVIVQAEYVWVANRLGELI